MTRKKSTPKKVAGIKVEAEHKDEFLALMKKEYAKFKRLQVSKFMDKLSSEARIKPIKFKKKKG